MRKSKPLTIFLVIIVVLIWVNGMRVFINSYYSDDYEEIIPDSQQNTPVAQKNISPAIDKKSKINKQENIDKKSIQVQKVAVRPVNVNEMKDLLLPARNPFDFFSIPRKRKPVADKKETDTNYQTIVAKNPEASDPGPGLRLLGIISGAKSSALLLSNKGEKKLVFENDEFSLNTIVKVFPNKIIVDHISGRSYVIDRIGWRAIQK